MELSLFERSGARNHVSGDDHSAEPAITFLGCGGVGAVRRGDPAVDALRENLWAGVERLVYLSHRERARHFRRGARALDPLAIDAASPRRCRLARPRTLADS